MINLLAANDDQWLENTLLRQIHFSVFKNGYRGSVLTGLLQLYFVLDHFRQLFKRLC